MRARNASDATRPVLGLTGVAFLHVAVYYIVTRLTLLRPADAFIDPHLPVDDWIPHLPWTWPAYWLPYVLVPIAAGAAIGRLDSRAFRRLFLSWCGMVVVGGAIQLVWPAVAPWPLDPGRSQRLYHDSALMLPYATLPSMHVAHVALAALVAGTVFRSATVRLTGALITVVVAASTLTLKEHVVLDAVSGLALALATWQWWRRAP